jgi:hypothetical protein
VQEVAALREQIDVLTPDLLVAGWVGNDMDLPNFLATRPLIWSVHRSFLVDFVARRWASSGDAARTPAFVACARCPPLDLTGDATGSPRRVC